MKRHFLLLCTLFCFSWLSAKTANDLPPLTEPVMAVDTPPCLGEHAKLRWYYWEKIPGYELDYLYVHPFFPQRPEGYEEVTALAAPFNYNNNFGALVRGYLTVPESGKYTFNLTGNNNTVFFFSTDDDPANVQQVCAVAGSTDEAEYYKYPEQTSPTFYLETGNFYYFEMHQKEERYQDFAYVHWNTPAAPDSTWEVIAGAYLYDYACNDFCLPKGTPCDDGDPNTTNDQEDGACNCEGIPQNQPDCVGERGGLEALYWDSIPGDNLADLYADDRYPMMPDRIEQLNRYSGPIVENTDEYGVRVRGFLRPPVSGTYQFNITGDDETYLYFSEMPSFDYATLIAQIPHWTFPVEHDKYIGQTSQPLQLDASKFYYIEINTKESTGRDHYTVFWKTPFQRDTSWKIIDGFHLYQYDCEIACIPEGTPCDDGDPQTYADQYDANCNCVGTPCPGGDCDTFLTPERFDACAPTDKHSTHPDDSWLSCQTVPSPNPARGSSHWIQYDLGGVVRLQKSHIWNYNVLNNTAMGFKDVVIDISVDGENWTQIGGTHQWQEAPGLSEYDGFVGPNFGNRPARYILLTALDSWDGGNCAGFSEWTFNTAPCPTPGRSCNDQNAQTVNDMFSADCACAGRPLPYNDCQQEHLTFGTAILRTGNYAAAQTIESRSHVRAGDGVNLVAETSITLKPGFHAEAKSSFVARLMPCGSSADNPLSMRMDSTEVLVAKTKPLDLRLMPNPTNNWTTIEYDLPKGSKVSIQVQDNQGRLITTLMSNQLHPEGVHQKQFPAHNIVPGVYFISLRTETDIVTHRLVVVE